MITGSAGYRDLSKTCFAEDLLAELLEAGGCNLRWIAGLGDKKARLSSYGESLMQWRLAEAKNRFSELVNRALAEGPQVVLRREDAVVVMDRREYERLSGKRPGFKEFLMGTGPSLDGLSLKRDSSPMRRIKL